MFVPSPIIFTNCQFVRMRLEARFVVQPLRTSMEAGIKEIWSLFQPHNCPIYNFDDHSFDFRVFILCLPLSPLC